MDEGKAYAVFECDAKNGEIEEELACIRSVVGTPSAVRIALWAVEKPPDAGGKGLFALEVKVPSALNMEASNELAALLNQAYNSPLWPVSL